MYQYCSSPNKKYKRDKGCQYRKLINNGQPLSGLCNGEIEATHVKGAERKDIIRYIVWCLANNKQPQIDYFLVHAKEIEVGSTIRVNLYSFKEAFKKFHSDNIERLIIPLCHKHHNQYDQR